MKKNIFMFLLLTSLSSSCLSDALGKINLIMTGTVVNYSCYVESDNSNKTVDLGKWSTKDFQKPGSTSQGIAFSINLKGCPPAGLTNITFHGTAANGEDGLLALDTSSTARNIAIQILEKDNSSLPLEHDSNQKIADENGDVNFEFLARYYSLTQDVSAGTANADATFTITYN